jgi:octaprenyl-diphosphate synthase
VPDLSTPADRLQSLLADDLAGVAALLRQRMESAHAPRIPEVTEHLIGAGGKRLRPMLTLAAARLCGYRGKAHRKLAAAVELIHTATLLHDDVVDESKRRRGRPTANLLWDNKSSVLVGDYLFSRSFQLMVECGALPVLGALANASAVIAEGEVLQLSVTRDLSIGPETCLAVARGKTAALFSAASESGAMLAGADKAAVAAFRTYGDALGIAFQLADDILDYAGDTGVIGKNAGDDLREGKVTLPVVLALRGAGADRAFWQRVIGEGDVTDGDLARAREILTETGALDAARAEARAWSRRAREAIAAQAATPIGAELAALTDYVVARIN